MSSAVPIWSGQQRALLAAMGYPLYRRAGMDAPAAAASGPNIALPWSAADRRLAQAVLASLAWPERLEPDLDPAGRWAALGLPDPAALRDAAGKRALWPRLRRLRRAEGR